MEINSKKQIKLCFDMLPTETQKALIFLSEQKWLSKSGWYLAGGTALALQVGHRRSVDLDFFMQKKDFNNVELLNHFADNKNWKVNINQENTIYGELYGAKISFIAYPFFIPKQKKVHYGTIEILQPHDIAIMKIIAASQRGRKRDFFDIYWYAQNMESLENLIRKLKIQYPSVAHDYHHILKSLVYFEDAESDPDPDISFKASWKDVKKFFIKEVPVVAAKLIDLRSK